MYIKITFNCKKINIKNNHKRYKISKQCHLQIAKREASTHLQWTNWWPVAEAIWGQHAICSNPTLASKLLRQIKASWGTLRPAEAIWKFRPPLPNYRGGPCPPPPLKKWKKLWVSGGEAGSGFQPRDLTLSSIQNSQ